MLNIIDLVIVALILFYLLKHAGGIIKTVKNLAVVLLILILFGLTARLLLNASFISGGARAMLEDAYFVKLSYVLIVWGYPAIQNNAPKIDSFVKEKIITNPAPALKTPKLKDLLISIPTKELDNLLEGGAIKKR
ncbi:hypothetical protein HZB07_07070 [Candidatus Saganbacteria bacterium]|nr:hypothetical protein [Candidatus Saganbacteria bacterium]